MYSTTTVFHNGLQLTAVKGSPTSSCPHVLALSFALDLSENQKLSPATPCEEHKRDGRNEWLAEREVWEYIHVFHSRLLCPSLRIHQLHYQHKVFQEAPDRNCYHQKANTIFFFGYYYYYHHLSRCFFVVIFKEEEGIREVDKEETTRAIFLANHLSNDTHHGSRISLSCLQLRIACPIKDPLHTAKQRACSVNTDINRLIFACVKSLSEQLKNHIPKEISRQAEKTGEKKTPKL